RRGAASGAPPSATAPRVSSERRCSVTSSTSSRAHAGLSMAGAARPGPTRRLSAPPIASADARSPPPDRR
ncbi:hypothetical protein HMPREF0731_1200, partial [Pseudoroseomonas cervicalis ATCC 49957]